MSTATKISKDEIIEAIKNFTMVEVSELVKELEEIFGVSAAAPVAMAAAPGAGGGDSAEAEQTEFSVILKSAGGNKIPVIKEVRAITGLALKDAKDLVEAGGKPIKEGIPKDEAEKLKEQLEKTGATVEIK